MAQRGGLPIPRKHKLANTFFKQCTKYMTKITFPDDLPYQLQNIIQWCGVLTDLAIPMNELDEDIPANTKCPTLQQLTYTDYLLESSILRWVDN